MASYDVEQASIARRRAIADALRQSGNQSFDPAAMAGRMVYKRSPLEDIAKVLQQGMAGWNDRKANREEAALKTRRDADARRAIESSLDTLAGPSNMMVGEKTAWDGTPLEQFPAMEMPDPFGGAPTIIGTEQNQARKNMAGILSGGDPQQMAQVASQMALQKMTEKPEKPQFIYAQQGTDILRANPDGSVDTVASNPVEPKTPSVDNTLVDIVDKEAPGGYSSIRRADWNGQQLWHKPDSVPAAANIPSTAEADSESEAEMIASGRKAMLPVTGRADVAARNRAINARAKEMNPRLDASTYGQRVRAQNAFAGSVEGRKLAALDTVTNHLVSAEEALKALNNGDVPAANAILNSIGLHVTGKPAPAVYNMVGHFVAGEIANALIPGQSAVADRERFIADFTNKFSPAAAAAVFAETKKLMAGRIAPLRRQYQSNTRTYNVKTGRYEESPEEFDSKLSPATLAIERQYNPDAFTPTDEADDKKLTDDEWAKMTPEEREVMKAAGYR